MKVLIEKDILRRQRNYSFVWGLVVSVLVYTGRNSDGRLSCRILSYDTVVGRINEQ